MAVMVILDWKGVTPAQYNTVREKVGWLEQPATGGICHVAAFEGDR